MSRERATKTEAEYLADERGDYAAKEESFERCDTDGFLSQWAHGQLAVKNRLLANLARNDGRIFVAVYVYPETGETVPARAIQTKYGTRVAVFASWSDCCSRSGEIVEWLSRKKADSRFEVAYFEAEGAVDSYAAKGAMNVSYFFVPFRGYDLGHGVLLADAATDAEIEIVDDPREVPVG